MAATPQISQLLTDHIADADTQWSLGAFGGIAEFSRDIGEPVELTASVDGVSAVTARGAIALKARSDIRPFASESITRESWAHRVALCLPEADCAMNRRTTLTELSRDTDALRGEDRDGVLFDLGLDILQADLCVRIREEAVVAHLREHTGVSVFDPENPAMGIILSANPHRVFISRIGRIEVFQPIPPPDGKSPEGPHTHILPKLLKSRRTHAATEPVPDGWIPCAHLYPSHPAKDALGRARPFDTAQHDAFQRMIVTLGLPDGAAIKQQVIAAVGDGQPPFSSDMARERFARTSIRVALRQLKAAGHPSRTLPAWLASFDHGREAADEEDDDARPHEH